jgi:deferrochelatase/peroxidase EfeB
MLFQTGVLPDAVIRDRRSTGVFAFLGLQPDLAPESAQAWLAALSEAVQAFEGGAGPEREGSALIALGPQFFVGAAGPRFGLEGKLPRHFADLPTTPAPVLEQAECLVYAMSTSEARIVRLLEAIAATRDIGLASVTVERGYQRDDGREPFGFPDGINNVPGRERPRVVFVDRERRPDEPSWTEDGSYLAYLKIGQDISAASTMTDLESVIGRRRDDGSRLDKPAGDDDRSDPPFADPANPPPSSHVRKVHDRESPPEHHIFRRGLPYYDLDSTAIGRAGLHFVSFQSSLDAFDAVFNGWMMNPDFPVTGAGPDALMARNLITFERAGFYFVPRADRRFVGAPIFDPPAHEPRPRREGRLIVRKRAVDAAGNRAHHAEVDGCRFVVQRQDGSRIGDEFETDASGHAMSGPLPVREPLELVETSAPANLDPSPAVSFTLEHHRDVIEVTNRVRPAGGYGT